MLPVLALAAVLCDPCSRTYPVGCTGSDCTTLSDTPTIVCASVSRQRIYEEGIEGVVLKWRPSDSVQWHTSEPIPAVEIVGVDGQTRVYFQGLTPYGPYSPGETRIYQSSTLPLHRYLDLPAGELVDVAIVPYNGGGAMNPIEVRCTGDSGCEPCGYLELCWYPIWDTGDDAPDVECW